MVNGLELVETEMAESILKRKSREVYKGKRYSNRDSHANIIQGIREWLGVFKLGHTRSTRKVFSMILKPLHSYICSDRAYRSSFPVLVSEFVPDH